MSSASPSSSDIPQFYGSVSGPRAKISYINGDRAPHTNYNQVESFIRALQQHLHLISPFYVDASVSTDAKKTLPKQDDSLPFDLALFNGKNIGLVVGGVVCNKDDLGKIVEALEQAGWEGEVVGWEREASR